MLTGWKLAVSVMGVKLLSCTGRRRQHERLDGWIKMEDSNWKNCGGNVSVGRS
jgi:hypothetical protein